MVTPSLIAFQINADGSDIPNQPQRLRSSNLVYMSATPLTTFLTTKKPLNETEIDPRFMLGRKPGSITVPIYASIVRKEADVIYDFVYYAFYPYNQGKLVAGRVFGNHVGDWEHVSLRISFRNSPNPRLLQAFNSQHSGGECLSPSNITFVLNTSHPIAYVARGSHGTYSRPGAENLPSHPLSALFLWLWAIDEQKFWSWQLRSKRVHEWLCFDLISGRTVYLQLPELGIELADEHDGASAVEWTTWKNVAVRVEGQPLASELLFLNLASQKTLSCTLTHLKLRSFSAYRLLIDCWLVDSISANFDCVGTLGSKYVRCTFCILWVQDGLWKYDCALTVVY